MSQILKLSRRALLAGACAIPFAGANAQDQQPIRIGFGMALSGGLAPGGTSALLTYQIWAEEVNARGGLLGRQVELVYYDDQSNPSTIPGIYSKLLDVDQVDIVLSGYATNMVVPAMPVVMAKKKMFLAHFALAANEQFNYDRYFTMQPSGPAPGAEFSRGFFELAAGLNPKPQKLAIVGSDSEFAIVAMNGARAHAEEQGLELVYDRSYPPATVDFSSIVRGIQAAQPDLIYMASYPTDSAGLIRAIYELKVSAQMLGGALVGLQFAALKTQFGDLLNGIVCYDYYAPEPTMSFPGIAEFHQKYRDRAAAAGVDPLGLYIAPFAYAQMQILEQAVTAVGSLDDAALSEHLHKTTFPTIVGDVAFAENGEWAQPRIITVQYQNVKGKDVEQFKNAGVQVIVHPPEYKSGDLQAPFDPNR